MNKSFGHDLCIQLFAGTDEKEKDLSGVKAPDAGEQSTGGKNTPDAGENTQAQRLEKFQALIRGEYRDLYDASVQNIVKKRLRGIEETVKKYRAIAPALRILEEKYGVEKDDAQALARALSGEEARQAEKARSMAGHQYRRWLMEAGEAEKSYPEFRLEKELADERFKSLIKSGVPMTDAYELVHRKELMEKAAGEMEERISRSMLSGEGRPRESGMGGQSSSLLKSDMSQMSKKTRQDIIRRVQRGERISF